MTQSKTNRLLVELMADPEQSREALMYRLFSLQSVYSYIHFTVPIRVWICIYSSHSESN